MVCCLTAVSYTHLYLLLERRTAGADGLTIETRLFELAGEALGREVPLAALPATAQLQPSLLPVSYTHLDVYKRQEEGAALEAALTRALPNAHRVLHGICVAKMLDKTSSIICAFGLASAAPCSPYRHLELCGIAYNAIRENN